MDARTESRGKRLAVRTNPTYSPGVESRQPKSLGDACTRLHPARLWRGSLTRSEVVPRDKPSLYTPHLSRATRSAAAFTVMLLVGAVLSAPVGADTDSQLSAAKAQLKRLIIRISVGQNTLSALQTQAN